MSNQDAISSLIQRRLRQEGLRTVTAVDASRWLWDAGLLTSARPDRDLRGMLRNGQIVGGRRDPPRRYGNWYIDRMQ